MRTLCCLMLMLAACASHEVRCDGRHLKPINPATAAAAVATPGVATPGVATPGVATRVQSP